MGTHEKPIRKIEYCAAVNAILTGGWDAAVKLWDPRTPTCVGSYLQPDVVLALSVCGDKFVVGTAKRKVCIWDLRNMAGMFQRRESSLKYQTRCIKGFPNEQVRLSLINLARKNYTVYLILLALNICSHFLYSFFLYLGICIKQHRGSSSCRVS